MANNADRVGAAQALVRTRWDTNQNIARALEQRTYLGALYGTSRYIPDGMVGMQIHLLLARGAALLYNADDIDTLTYVLAVANSVVPGLQHLEPAAADARVLACLTQFLKTEITRRGFIEVTEQQWAAWTAGAEEGRPAGPLANVAWIPRARNQVRNMEVPRAATPDEMNRVFGCLLSAGRQVLVDEGPGTMFAAAFLGFAKKGDITTRKLESIIAQMHEEVGYTMSLSTEVVRAMWHHVGVYVPYELLPQMFRAWEEATETISLRMRVTLQQAAWTGLTQYSTILRMVEDHPDFPWARVAGLLASDWSAFMKAVDTVGNDPYYGFKANVGDAAATKFLNLGYVAKEMMRKLGGREAGAITQYRGWISTPRCQATLDEIIRDWVPGGDTGAVAPDHAAVALLRQKIRVSRGEQLDVPAGIPEPGEPAPHEGDEEGDGNLEGEERDADEGDRGAHAGRAGRGGDDRQLRQRPRR
ncbi:nucleoprotein [Karukera tick virus]|uniref:Nucleoprotein n=1 Tax=Karukera tick virus TaxID=2678334 RepID=A0A6B9CUM0_9VIRU|nr:nucleoprotein [Karukera tick virus]QGW51124.1 nucleoprotein [Karukera tick virus]